MADRAAEVWEPLLAIADLAGGHWPDTARAAAVHFVTSTNRRPVSFGTRLLADLRDLYTRNAVDRMLTADIIEQLCALEEAPWADLSGRPLDGRRLARELGRYGVGPKDIKLPDGSVRKGYRADGPDGLADAWTRYLPQAATAATSATPQVRAVAASSEVADTSATSRPQTENGED